MSNTDLHQETGAAWNETAAIYERDEVEQIAFLRAGGSTLMEPERRLLGDLRPWCQRAIHLQCAGGSDTLSLLQQGAHEVVGVDISERMIAVARRKTEALNAPASWYCSDVLATPSVLDGTADLVYTGRGALPWMMDITAWAGVVTRLLKSGGYLYVFEGHPLDWVWDTAASTYQLHPEHGNYFSPYRNNGRWPAQFLSEQGREDLQAHEHQWTLGDILNAVVASGLSLVRFEEHPDLYWDQFPDLPEDLARRLPHTFSLLAQKR